MALLEGDIDRAAALLAEAAEIATAIGDKRHISLRTTAGSRWVAYLERRWEDADAHARESLRLARELGMKLQMVEEISCLAGDRRRQRRHDAGSSPCRRGGAPPLAPRTGTARSRTAATTERSIESAKAACDPETWERALAEGRAMSLDDAADYALSTA